MMGKEGLRQIVSGVAGSSAFSLLVPQYTDRGVYGAPWAIVASFVLRGVIYSVYFKGGWWKSRMA
jgi:Na+-driven multidrug efflux pump